MGQILSILWEILFGHNPKKSGKFLSAPNFFLPVRPCSGYTIFFDNAHNFLYYIVLQFWLSAILIITNEWCHQKLTNETKLSTNRFCLPTQASADCSVVLQPWRCHCCIKTRIGTKTDLIFLYMKLLLSSICMSNDSFKYYYRLYIIWFCTVCSSKLASATGHATPINLHLFE